MNVGLADVEDCKNLHSYLFQLKFVGIRQKRYRKVYRLNNFQI